jgi:hypothetical protein
VFDDAQRADLVGGVVGVPHVGDHPRVDDLVAVEHEERAVDRVTGLQQCVAAAQLLLLHDVLERRIPVRVPEVIANVVALVADHDGDRVHAGVDERVEDVREDRAVRGGEHRLGP